VGLGLRRHGRTAHATGAIQVGIQAVHGRCVRRLHVGVDSSSAGQVAIVA